MAGIRSEREIYAVLEKHLRLVDKAMTCVDLMDIPDIRESATAEFGKDIRNATNKVSDTLGFMWRRGLLTRYPAPKETSSLARYAYAWDKSRDATLAPKPIPSPSLSQKKLGVLIEEMEGGVKIEFEKFVVFVKPK